MLRKLKFWRYEEKKSEGDHCVARKFRFIARWKLRRDIGSFSGR